MMGNTNILIKKSKQRNIASKFHKVKKLTLSVMTMMCVFCMTSIQCFASSTDTTGVDKFNNVMDLLATWIGRIGLAIGFVGAIGFAMGVKDADAESKNKGLMTLASGFIVFAVCTGWKTFFI